MQKHKGPVSAATETEPQERFKLRKFERSSPTRRRRPVIRAELAGARSRAAQIAYLRDVFELRAQARAILVEACLLDFHAAIDGLQEFAQTCGLVCGIGQNAVQAIMAAAFRSVPR